MKKLSKRATSALKVLESGGYFEQRLEAGFNGREQFRTRLYNANGGRIDGIGIKTYHELLGLGVLMSRHPGPRTSAWARRFGLANPPCVECGQPSERFACIYGEWLCEICAEDIRLADEG